MVAYGHYNEPYWQGLVSKSEFHGREPPGKSPISFSLYIHKLDLPFHRFIDNTKTLIGRRCSL